MLRLRRVGRLLVLPDEIVFAVQGGVDRKTPVVEKERPIAVGANECGRFGGHAIFDMLAGGSLKVQLRRKPPRGHVTSCRPGPIPMRNVDVKTLIARTVGLAPEVPFSEMPGRVAGAAQRLGERDVAGIEPSDARRHQTLILRTRSGHARLKPDFGQMTDRCRNAEPGRVLTGQNAGSRGGAQRIGGVSLPKQHSPPGQPVEMRRLMKRAAIASQVAPTQVIRQNQHDVRTIGGPGRPGRQPAHPQAHEATDTNSIDLRFHRVPDKEWRPRGSRPCSRRAAAWTSC